MALMTRRVNVGNQVAVLVPATNRAVDVALRVIQGNSLMIGGALLVTATARDNAYEVGSGIDFRWRLAAGEDMFGISGTPDDPVIVLIMSN